MSSGSWPEDEYQLGARRDDDLGVRLRSREIMGIDAFERHCLGLVLWVVRTGSLQSWYLPELIRIQSRLRPFCRRNIIRQTKNPMGASQSVR
jgi:hypothetical protein